MHRRPGRREADMAMHHRLARREEGTAMHRHLSRGAMRRRLARREEGTTLHRPRMGVPVAHRPAHPQGRRPAEAPIIAAVTATDNRPTRLVIPLERLVTGPRRNPKMGAGFPRSYRMVIVPLGGTINDAWMEQ